MSQKEAIKSTNGKCRLCLAGDGKSEECLLTISYNNLFLFFFQDLKYSTIKYVEFTNDDRSIAAKWYRFVKSLHQQINKTLVLLARNSAKNPKSTITTVIVISLAVLVIGLFTGFNVDVNEDTLWSPRGSGPLAHYEWIEDSSGFPGAPRSLFLNIHANGESVIAKEGMERVFVAFDTVRDTSGYNEVCGIDEVACFIDSPTAFWNHSLSFFESQVTNDDDVILALSTSTYPSGLPVDLMAITGNPTIDEVGFLVDAAVFLVKFDLPPLDPITVDFEELVLEKLLELQEKWIQEDGNKFRVDFFAERSFSDEFSRAIVKDIPLVPAVFVIMSIFTSLVFWQRDQVQSRATLGFGAVCCVLLAIMTGYGLLFICGVPFTSMTQILPFIMFGIGLDAAFIITGSFFRTDSKRDLLERIEETIAEVGISITLTTITSALAFGLGCISSIPAVIWLCLYAFPTIIIDLVYQLTFFIAIMALDEKRVLENRRDCLCCVTVEQQEEEEDEKEKENYNEGDQGDEYDASTRVDSLSDRFMEWYADKLLKNGFVKFGVVAIFTGLLAGCAYSASLLEQNFDFTEVVPDDSYITPFFDVLNTYTSRGGAIVEIYFRNEDQSSIEVQQQMEDYVNDLVNMKQIDSQPPYFWLRDFTGFVDANQTLQNLTFYEQFEVFYNNPVFNDIYADHIVLDKNGLITSSRTTVYMNNINDDIVTELIEALEDQRDLSSQQPVNNGKKDWSFFTYSELYLIWEFYSVAVNELTMSTILGVVSVTVLSTLLMPHWTAFFFVGPLICILYVDLLGVLQLAGIAVNPVSYIAMVMSIGLLVDFIVHMLLRYYEVQGDRTTRTKEMLRTMGSSVMLGGLSTFLGVLPLAFSTSTVFFTIFVTFMGLVTLGIGHGLILLPVLLSIFGPDSKLVEDIEGTDHAKSLQESPSAIEE